MIVDASALVAIAFDEPERGAMLHALERAERALVCAATYVEAGIVLDATGIPEFSRRFDGLLAEQGIRVVELTPSQAVIARQAYRDFGRGSGHRARLNFGDCLAYALAIDTDEPLLFKGDDFAHTDVRRVSY